MILVGGVGNRFDTLDTKKIVRRDTIEQTEISPEQYFAHFHF